MMLRRSDAPVEPTCRADPDAMFPGPSNPGAVAAAKRVCGTCPLRLPCLAYALDHREEFGVWGGTSVKERHRLRKRHPQVTDWRRLLAEVDTSSQLAA